MATGIQTGIRTGSAPLPTGKGPGGGGGLGKVLASWSALSTTVKIAIVSVIVLAIGGGALYMGIVAANKPVPLYATNLSPSDVTEISQKLNQLGHPYTIEGGKILVPPGERSRIVGVLIGYGLPHRALQGPSADGGMTPKTEFEKRKASEQSLENELIDQIRQFDIVADAYVKLVIPDEADLLGGSKDAKANVFLALKPGQAPKKMQIEAIINLVAYSVDGLKPENVKVTDKTGFVWNDGTTIANAPGGGGEEGAYEDEKLAIKKAYEQVYQSKIQTSLDKILGSENYTVTVDADIDFTQTKIETTQVGEPGGNNTVVSVVKKDVEKYNSENDKDKPAKPGSSQVGLPGGGNANQDTAYEKVKYEQKVETGKVTKTAIIAPGVVKKVTTNVAVNGKKDQAELAKLQQVAAAAIGLDASRGDIVTVVDVPFNMQNSDPALANWVPNTSPVSRSNPNSPPAWMLAAMVVPTLVLLGVLAVFLLKQRKVQAERSGLILQGVQGTTTSDISDLLSDKIGRSTATSQTTKVNNTEQLEKLAKEKPTKVAELLKSTWLSDKER